MTIVEMIRQLYPIRPLLPGTVPTRPISFAVTAHIEGREQRAVRELAEDLCLSLRESDRPEAVLDRDGGQLCLRISENDGERLVLLAGEEPLSAAAWVLFDRAAGFGMVSDAPRHTVALRSLSARQQHLARAVLNEFAQNISGAGSGEEELARALSSRMEKSCRDEVDAAPVPSLNAVPQAGWQRLRKHQGAFAPRWQGTRTDLLRLLGVKWKEEDLRSDLEAYVKQLREDRGFRADLENTRKAMMELLSGRGMAGLANSLLRAVQLLEEKLEDERHGGQDRLREELEKELKPQKMTAALVRQALEPLDEAMKRLAGVEIHSLFLELCIRQLLPELREQILGATRQMQAWNRELASFCRIKDSPVQGPGLPWLELEKVESRQLSIPEVKWEAGQLYDVINSSWPGTLLPGYTRLSWLCAPVIRGKTRDFTTAGRLQDVAGLNEDLLIVLMDREEKS